MSPSYNFPVHLIFRRCPDLVHKLQKKYRHNIIVLISGCSGCGKTHFAEELKDFFGKSRSLIFSIDNYYQGKDYVKKHNITFDHPQSIDFDLLVQDLQKLKNNESINCPVYDFVTSSRTGFKEIKPEKLIIVEGIFALQPQLQSLGDYKIYINCDIDTQIYRRIIRDIDRKKQDPLKILKICEEIVIPLQDKYIVPHKKDADVVVENKITSKEISPSKVIKLLQNLKNK